MTTREEILHAARADGIPKGESGLWSVHKFGLSGPFNTPRQKRVVTIPAGRYTQLFRMTRKAMENFVRQPFGDLVMQDTPDELATHLQFMLRAHGRVLITGLGLGCVARGCLANPRVRHVVVIERDPHVLGLVGPHMPGKRLTVIMADAVEWVKKHPRKFDCAWHDLWSDEDKGERHLQCTHGQLITELCRHVRFQGAWQLPRFFKRSVNRRFPDAIL